MAENSREKGKELKMPIALISDNDIHRLTHRFVYEYHIYTIHILIEHFSGSLLGVQC